MPRLFKRFTIRDGLALAGILAITALGLSLLGRALLWGVWAYSDSTAYIVSARMLASGHGLGLPTPEGGFSPLALHPPLYPLLISVLFSFNLDPLDALSAVNLALFAAAILISGGLTYSLTRDPLLAISTSALVALPPTMLRNFDGAMTEPLYIPLSILAVLLLAWYWYKGSRMVLAAAGLVTGLAGLARYTGLSLVAAGLLVILLNGQPSRRRIQDAALFAALGAGPLLVWFIHLYLQSGLLAARSFSSDGGLGGKIQIFRKNLMETLVLWVPYIEKSQTWFQKALVTYALLGLGTLAGGLAWWKAFHKGAVRSQQVESGLKLMAAAFFAAAAYLAFVFFSYLFSSIPPDINDRTLAPLMPLLVLFLCAGLFVTPSAFGLHRIFTLAPLIVILAACQYYYAQTSSLASSRDQQSRGYAAPRWRTSELMQAVRDLPADAPLISNMPVPVLLYTNRFPYPFQELDLRQRGAVLIIFEPEFSRQMADLYGDAGSERANALLTGLEITRQAQDGAFYIFK